MSNPTEAVLAIEVVLGGGRNATSVAEAYAPQTDMAREHAVRLAGMFEAIAGGQLPAKVRTRVQSVTGVRASLTLALTQANIAVAEYFDLVAPNGGRWRLTAVASGAANGDGTFNSATSDTATALSAKNAINSLPGARDYFVADSSSGNLIVSAREYGTRGNTFSVVDGTVNGMSPAGGSLAAGVDPSGRATSTITCVAANTDADDTLRIGKTTFTAKAGDASGESQFNIGASDTAMGDNLLAKIVAHADLLGLVTGINASGVVTLTWQCDPRVAVHMYMVSSDADGIVLTAQPATTLTLTSSQSTRTYALGAP